MLVPRQGFRGLRFGGGGVGWGMQDLTPHDEIVVDLGSKVAQSSGSSLVKVCL